ncbi:MAG TPA: SPOR domain-containing protein [Pyrinomonadaceae bacterium]|nr:SPOR domain-containing protein [Pyrinomonadaceae bacterium]
METEIETRKRVEHIEPEIKHSALEEFSRDERRPAVILLGLLALGAVFFAIGILVGRFTVEDMVSAHSPQAQTSAAQTAATSQPDTQQTTAEAVHSTEQRYAVLVGRFKTPEDAQSLVRDLTGKGYTDIRTEPSGRANTQKIFSLLIGHYTRQEAEQEAARMRSAHDQRLKSASVVEAPQE